MGSDLASRLTISDTARFQSTPPAWGATQVDYAVCGHIQVSIHAPRMGSDIEISTALNAQGGFNPRPPHGERRDIDRDYLRAICFNPRPPHGERPSWARAKEPWPMFQSTPPAWGATNRPFTMVEALVFQSTPPAWGATGALGYLVDFIDSFNPRPPHGERPQNIAPLYNLPPHIGFVNFFWPAFAFFYLNFQPYSLVKVRFSVRTSQDSPVHFRFAIQLQATSVPSKSSDGLAPT